jgi:hypothetical protein
MVQSEKWCPSKATEELHTQRMFGILEDRRTKTLEQMVDQNIVVHIEDKISIQPPRLRWNIVALQTRQPVQSGLARLTDPFANITHLGVVFVCVFCIHRIPHMCIN